MAVCGIYEIKHKVDGRRYIGSSINIEARFSQHRRELKRNVHPNQKLQHAWNKYGANAFSFSVLEIADASQLKDAEQQYLDEIFSSGCEVFNISRFAYAPMRGLKHNQALIEHFKITNAGEGNPFFGKQHSEETKQKISNSKAGAPAWNKGVPHTLEVIERISKAKLGSVSPNKGKRSLACKRGHEWTEASTYMNKGVRNCRICMAQAVKRYQLKLKGISS